MAGGVAQINCGAATETEMKERKALLEDAKAATAAALEEGIVPGGGVALLRSEKALSKLKLEGDEAPRRRDHPQCAGAAVACDRQERRSRRSRCRQSRSPPEGQDEGYNADTDTYEDLVAAGVIDPAKVVRTALQNAASVASPCCSPPSR